MTFTNVSGILAMMFGLGGFSPTSALCGIPPVSQQSYKEMSRDLRATAKSARKFIRLHELAESSQGRTIWLAEVGRGEDAERNARPALLLVAGIEGNDISGSTSAMHWLHVLAEGAKDDETIQALLDSTTIYVVPRLNPDSLESFFAEPRTERWTNFDPVDDDHDGLTDEDGGEDLNGDGVVSWMRIQDPVGDFILDETDPRILIKADPIKGEKGAWKLLPEGIDNDEDEAWNEDGPGGVNFNRNYPYGYRYFDEDSGRHPVSQPETRALADFVVAHPNIGVVFSFGMADNLLTTPQGESNPKRPPTAMQETDVSILRALGETWREGLGLDKELSGAEEPGTFSDWIYFHRGRLSLTTQPWSLELGLQLAQVKEKESNEKNQLKKASSESGEEASGKREGDSVEDEGESSASGESHSDKESKKKKPDKRSEQEREYLKWSEEHFPEAFIPWKEYQHPDFPGQRVEIGGWAPFARCAVPPAELTHIVQRHAAFFTTLAGQLPRVAVRNVKLQSLGSSIYDITAEVENAGYLPTALAQGTTTREVFPTRVTLEVEDDLILGGSRRVMVDSLPGSGGMTKVRWVCHLPDRASVEMTVISMLGGSVRHTIELKEKE